MPWPAWICARPSWARSQAPGILSMISFGAVGVAGLGVEELDEYGVSQSLGVGF